MFESFGGVASGRDRGQPRFDSGFVFCGHVGHQHRRTSSFVVQVQTFLHNVVCNLVVADIGALAGNSGTAVGSTGCFVDIPRDCTSYPWDRMAGCCTWVAGVTAGRGFDKQLGRSLAWGRLRGSCKGP